jgi:hypothetical protein
MVAGAMAKGPELSPQTSPLVSPASSYFEEPDVLVAPVPVADDCPVADAGGIEVPPPDVPIWPVGEVAPGAPAELLGAVAEPSTVALVCAIAGTAANRRPAAANVAIFT